MIKKILSILAPILFLTLVYFYGGNIMGNKTQTNGTQNNQNQINKNMKIALLKTTAGDIEIALNDKETPITANNFITLAKKKFYDNTIFHRAIKGFMIQGGDPEGTGMGGPGYKFNDEPFSGEYTRGTIAMANSGPNTNGSQFFIMHSDYPLPKNYVIFGKVIKGIEVVDKIATAPVSYNSSGELSKPVKPVVINSVEIIEQ
jgi:cyclophilin family peptidyl-prolyl cis-trans isomerase